MSLASRIVGIPGLEVERVHRRKGIEIWAKPFHRPSCLYCGSKQLRIKAIDKRTVNHSRQGCREMTLHLKSPKYHCRDCGRYFRHRFTGIRPRFRSTQGYSLEVFEAKQKLIRYVLLKMLTKRRMARKLPGFLKLIDQLQQSPLKSLANTLKSWLEPIVAIPILGTDVAIQQKQRYH